MNRYLLLVFCGLTSQLAMADGAVVDKVYHPFVMPDEREIEWRFTSRQSDEGNVLSQRLAYGHSLSEHFTMEGYLVFDRDPDDHDNFGLQAYEIEARWQLTEQGQYWADWGMAFELEKQHQVDNWEFSTGLLFEKEYYRSSLTLNSFVIYEWGSTLDDEIEFEFRAQYRYRWLPELQPAIELYTGEDFVGIGPGLMGVHRYQGQKQLKYELAFITGLNGHSKDHTLRFALEWEF